MATTNDALKLELKKPDPVSTVTMYEPGAIAVGSSATMSEGVAPKTVMGW
jgi:hypothetical protein